jgi:LysM repeat protein
MKKTTFKFMVMILVLSLILTGCERSLTKGSADVPTSTSEIPFPVGPSTNPNRMTEIVAGTQTAMAPAEATAMPEAPAEATATPEPVAENPEIAPTQPVVFATATPGSPTTYTIQKGEFPYCIARRFNVNPADLLSINNIGSNVAVGATLKIPTNSIWPADVARSLRNHPTTYTVQSGDTVYRIGCLFGDVDPNTIIAANSLQSPYNLTAGQVLQIP